jgi:cholesterol oxidase
MRDSYDAVVIGSGFGGAVVACRLAEAGRSVAVLERGRRWHRSEFPRAIGEVAERAFWEPGRSHGFIEYASFRNVDVIQGAGVGGGSLHYFNVNVPAAPEIFADRRWPADLTRDVLDPYYERALGVLESATLRPPPGRDALPTRTVVFTEAARRAGLDTQPLPLAVYTSEPRVNPVTGEEQNPCNYSGNCLFGCNIGAKNTLDTNYLARAERLHGAEIHALHSVDAIRSHPMGGYEVRYRHLEDDPQSPSTAGTVHAAEVVVAAGALGSTQLLLRCRDRDGGLPKLPRSLGTKFSLNGEMLLAFASHTPSLTNPGLGPPITARATAQTADHLITVEDLGLPDALFWYLEGGLDLRLGRLSGMASLLIAYARSLMTRGGADLRLDRLVGDSVTSRVIPYLGMGNDSSDGQIRLDGDSLEIDWSVGHNRQLYKEMYSVMGRIAKAAGARFVPSIFYRWPLRKLVTAHPLGGCAMGDDPATSVVDHRGQVWGHPGLYVVDGSVMPTALAVNPSLTIAAVAERSAHWMVHGREAGTTYSAQEQGGS